MTISKKILKSYYEAYPEIPKKKLKKELEGLKKRFGKLDAITVNYYLVSKFKKELGNKNLKRLV